MVEASPDEQDVNAKSAVIVKAVFVSALFFKESPNGEREAGTNSPSLH